MTAHEPDPETIRMLVDCMTHQIADPPLGDLHLTRTAEDIPTTPCVFGDVADHGIAEHRAFEMDADEPSALAPPPPPNAPDVT